MQGVMNSPRLKPFGWGSLAGRSRVIAKVGALLTEGKQGGEPSGRARRELERLQRALASLLRPFPPGAGQVGGERGQVHMAHEVSCRSRREVRVIVRLTGEKFLGSESLVKGRRETRAIYSQPSEVSGKLFGRACRVGVSQVCLYETPTAKMVRIFQQNRQ